MERIGKIARVEAAAVGDGMKYGWHQSDIVGGDGMTAKEYLASLGLEPCEVLHIDRAMEQYAAHVNKELIEALRKIASAQDVLTWHDMCEIADDVIAKYGGKLCPACGAVNPRCSGFVNRPCTHPYHHEVQPTWREWDSKHGGKP